MGLYKLECVIHREMLRELKHNLTQMGISGFNICEISGVQANEQRIGIYRGARYILDSAPKVKLEMFVRAEEAERLTDQVIRALNAAGGDEGDIALTPVETLIHLRKGAPAVREALHGTVLTGT